jgi:hypothetical protein
MAKRFLRIAGALLVLAAGAIHLWLYFDYFEHVQVIGVLFLLNAAAAAVVGAGLLLSRSRLVVAAGVAFAAGTLAAFLFSVYHGLFGYTERLSGSWQEAAGAVELAAIAALLPVLRPDPRGISLFKASERGSRGRPNAATQGQGQRGRG